MPRKIATRNSLDEDRTIERAKLWEVADRLSNFEGRYESDMTTVKKTLDTQTVILERLDTAHKRSEGARMKLIGAAGIGGGMLGYAMDWIMAHISSGGAGPTSP